jgi:hypothetical protein
MKGVGLCGGRWQHDDNDGRAAGATSGTISSVGRHYTGNPVVGSEIGPKCSFGPEFGTMTPNEVINRRSNRSQY